MEIIGSVSIESSIKTKPIINVYINPNILFNNYIIHNPFSDREIFEIANSATKN
jgi:hypothetical protein